MCRTQSSVCSIERVWLSQSRPARHVHPVARGGGDAGAAGRAPWSEQERRGEDGGAGGGKDRRCNRVARLAGSNRLPKRCRCYFRRPPPRLTPTFLSCSRRQAALTGTGGRPTVFKVSTACSSAHNELALSTTMFERPPLFVKLARRQTHSDLGSLPALRSAPLIAGEKSRTYSWTSGSRPQEFGSRGTPQSHVEPQVSSETGYRRGCGPLQARIASVTKASARRAIMRVKCTAPAPWAEQPDQCGPTGRRGG